MKVLNQTSVTIDIHGCTVEEGKKRLLSKIKSVSLNVKEIIVIHGCNNGTKLQNMVRGLNAVGRIESINPSFLNDGKTTIYLK